MSAFTNMPEVIKNVKAKLSQIDVQRLTTIQATTLIGVMRDRIHIQGKDSNGTPIGTYTPAYIKYQRAKKGRGTDPKVILSLTRSMENSYSLIQLPNGVGISLTTQENYQKARFCEVTYGKKIFSPTTEERSLVDQIAEEYISKLKL